MARRRTLARLGLGLVALATLASAVPLTGLVAAAVVADGFGCVLDEGSVHACLVAGHDVGPALYAAFVGGWLVLLAVPAMLAAALFWLGWGVRCLIRRRRRRAAGRPPARAASH